jgi:integrase
MPLRSGQLAWRFLVAQIPSLLAPLLLVLAAVSSAWAATTVVVGSDPSKTVVKGTLVTPDQVIDGELVIEGDTITCAAATCTAPKSGKARRVDMSQQLQRVLQAHLTLRAAEAVVAGRADAAWLFPDPERPDGALPLDPTRCYKIVWWPLLRRSGLRYRNPHTLRHTFASLLLQQARA